ncbi:MAG: Rpn family recombination-promoting nuclease/putative transposase, partial [Saprospiraceae bacterium]
MKKEINHPHDKIFKTLLADREVAIDFLNNFLPENVKNFIDIDNFHHVNSSFVSEELKETFSDIVLKCPMKNSDKEIFVTIIIEHKSQPEK